MTKYLAFVLAVATVLMPSPSVAADAVVATLVVSTGADSPGATRLVLAHERRQSRMPGGRLQGEERWILRADDPCSSTASKSRQVWKQTRSWIMEELGVFPVRPFLATVEDDAIVVLAGMEQQGSLTPETCVSVYRVALDGSTPDAQPVTKLRQPVQSDGESVIRGLMFGEHQLSILVVGDKTHPHEYRFDLDNLEWRTVVTSAEPIPPITSNWVEFPTPGQ